MYTVSGLIRSYTVIRTSVLGSTMCVRCLDSVRFVVRWKNHWMCEGIEIYAATATYR
jgi:hypothetical protein